MKFLINVASIESTPFLFIEFIENIIINENRDSNKSNLVPLFRN